MRIFLLLVFMLFGFDLWGQTAPFDSGNFTVNELLLDDGRALSYKAFDKIYYVGNVEDSLYQYMNIYVPEGVDDSAPIILRTFSNNFYSSHPKAPSAVDITGMALARGYVVCVIGVRGCNSFDVRNVYQLKKKKSVLKGQEIVYTGKMPAPVLDIKSAVRFLRANDQHIPGSCGRIVAVGVGTNSMLMMMLGVSANAPDFEPFLQSMGACAATDDVFATACLSPYFITGGASMDGGFQLTASHDDYLRSVLMNSARAEAAMGRHIPDSLGAEYFADTFVSDDITDYMVDFDVRRFAAGIAHHSGKRIQLIDTAYYFAGGLADSIGVDIRKAMCDPFVFLGRHALSPCPHWLLSHGATENPAMFPLTYRLSCLLREAMMDVDLRIPFGRQSAKGHDYYELLQWIDSL